MLVVIEMAFGLSLEDCMNRAAAAAVTTSALGLHYRLSITCPVAWGTSFGLPTL